jgi:probable F420-dependent oxidoreductase
MMRPFRFGGGLPDVQSREELAEAARKLEALGYATAGTGDHISFGGFASIPMLVALADATSTLRLSSIFAMDFRNPALLAHEAATVDRLSGGRLELGLGAGWWRGDYEALGVAFEPPGVRLSRLTEGVQLIRRLFREESVSHAGAYFTVQNLNLQPKPVQQPHPPLFIGGGRRRVLELAAREADIVGLDLASMPNGTLDAMGMAAEAVAEKVAWVHTAAGERIHALEFHVNVLFMVVTDSQQSGIEAVRAQMEAISPLASNMHLSDEQLLHSPYVLIGSRDQMAEKLLMLRERYGISYFSMIDSEAGAPVVARLAGT